MHSAKLVKTAHSDIFICRLEDNGDGQLVMRKLKTRETTSENCRYQLKYDMEESRFDHNNL